MLNSFVIDASEGYFLCKAEDRQGSIQLGDDGSIILKSTGETYIFLNRIEGSVHYSFNVYEQDDHWRVCITSSGQGLIYEHEYISYGGDGNLLLQSAYVNGEPKQVVF